MINGQEQNTDAVLPAGNPERLQHHALSWIQSFQQRIIFLDKFVDVLRCGCVRGAKIKALQTGTSVHTTGGTDEEAPASLPVLSELQTKRIVMIDDRLKRPRQRPDIQI